jgi:hypothetical protein
MLIRYVGARNGKAPTKLDVADIDADMVADFLSHVEASRGNTVRSRNARLAAIRSFFRYVAMTEPAWRHHCQRVLAMPNKRQVKRAVTFLDAEEIAALLGAPDRSTWIGRRDHALLLLALQTDQFYTGNLANFAPGLTESRLPSSGLQYRNHLRCRAVGETSVDPTGSERVHHPIFT